MTGARQNSSEHHASEGRSPQHGSCPAEATPDRRSDQLSGQQTGQVFEPEELQALAAAFEKCVEAVAPPPWAERQPGAEHYAKETVAKVVLGVARTGERNPEVIVAATVDRLTIR